MEENFIEHTSSNFKQTPIKMILWKFRGLKISKLSNKVLFSTFRKVLWVISTA